MRKVCSGVFGKAGHHEIKEKRAFPRSGLLSFLILFSPLAFFFFGGGGGSAEFSGFVLALFAALWRHGVRSCGAWWTHPSSGFRKLLS